MLCSYEPRGDDELALTVDDIVVARRDPLLPDGWVQARSGDRVGRVQAAYLDFDDVEA